MTKIGQIVAHTMAPGAPNHVSHIAKLQWQSSNIGLVWSSREEMVNLVDRHSPGTFFTEVGGYHAYVYSVHHGSSSWVQTEPDETKVDNLLRLP